MDILRRSELNELVRVRDGSCVSIYLPTHPSMPETQKDPIRFKNLLAEAEAQLVAMGIAVAKARDLLKQLRELLEDRDFWLHQTDGLTVFASESLLRAFRLPRRFDELVVVTERFHIKPLLPLFAFDGRFYILALSQNQARLFEASKTSISELFPEGIPQDLNEALKPGQPERGLQFHTRAPQAGDRRAAVFHGHGTGVDDNKDRLLRYCREIDGALQPLFKDETAPLVLASVDYLLPIYRSANTYSHLVEKGISGNPELLHAYELRQRGWEIVAPFFSERLDNAASKYRHLAGTGRTSTDLKEIVSAAINGRLESLFVALGIRRWGRVDSESGVQLHDDAQPGDEDLLDRAGIETLTRGGDVFAVKPERIPAESDVAAIFRY